MDTRLDLRRAGASGQRGGAANALDFRSLCVRAVCDPGRAHTSTGPCRCPTGTYVVAEHVIDAFEWTVPDGGAPPSSVQVAMFPGREESAIAASVPAGPIEFDVPEWATPQSLPPGKTVWINIRWAGADKVIYRCPGPQAADDGRLRRVVSWEACVSAGEGCTTPQLIDVSCLASMLGVEALTWRLDAAFWIHIDARAGQ